MNYQQRKMVEWMEGNVARFDLAGYAELARQLSAVLEFVYAGETVMAVLAASSGRLGAEFTERLRKTFRVGRVE